MPEAPSNDPLRLDAQRARIDSLASDEIPEVIDDLVREITGHGAEVCRERCRLVSYAAILHGHALQRRMASLVRAIARQLDTEREMRDDILRMLGSLAKHAVDARAVGELLVEPLLAQLGVAPAGSAARASVLLALHRALTDVPSLSVADARLALVGVLTAELGAADAHGAAPLCEAFLPLLRCIDTAGARCAEHELRDTVRLALLALGGTPPPTATTERAAVHALRAVADTLTSAAVVAATDGGGGADALEGHVRALYSRAFVAELSEWVCYTLGMLAGARQPPASAGGASQPAATTAAFVSEAVAEVAALYGGLVARPRASSPVPPALGASAPGPTARREHRRTRSMREDGGGTGVLNRTGGAPRSPTPPPRVLAESRELPWAPTPPPAHPDDEFDPFEWWSPAAAERSRPRLARAPRAATNPLERGGGAADARARPASKPSARAGGRRRAAASSADDRFGAWERGASDDGDEADIGVLRRHAPRSRRTHCAPRATGQLGARPRARAGAGSRDPGASAGGGARGRAPRSPAHGRAGGGGHRWDDGWPSPAAARARAQPARSRSAEPQARSADERAGPSEALQRARAASHALREAARQDRAAFRQRLQAGRGGGSGEEGGDDAGERWRLNSFPGDIEVYVSQRPPPPPPDLQPRHWPDSHVTQIVVEGGGAGAELALGGAGGAVPQLAGSGQGWAGGADARAAWPETESTPPPSPSEIRPPSPGRSHEHARGAQPQPPHGVATAAGAGGGAGGGGTFEAEAHGGGGGGTARWDRLHEPEAASPIIPPPPPAAIDAAPAEHERRHAPGLTPLVNRHLSARFADDVAARFAEDREFGSVGAEVVGGVGAGVPGTARGGGAPWPGGGPGVHPPPAAAHDELTRRVHAALGDGGGGVSAEAVTQLVHLRAREIEVRARARGTRTARERARSRAPHLPSRAHARRPACPHARTRRAPARPRARARAGAAGRGAPRARAPAGVRLRQ